MKITYIFGAGASCSALPMVGQIPERISKMIKLLNGQLEIDIEKEWKHQSIKTTYGKILEKLVEDLFWLKENSENHASIDTFAKKLTINQNWDDLKKLKRSFSAYFSLEQIINPIDKRYDSFFASILNELGEFPNNTRILSWNYDIQFEKSYSEYSRINEIDKNRFLLNVVQKNTRIRASNEKFCIVKLNGSCSIIENPDRTHEFCNNQESNLSNPILERILGSYQELQVFSNLKYALSFAWEKADMNIVDYAIKETNDTEILVYIGYSMPYFNREIDRKIIKEMKNLKKVYFQSPEAEALKDRFSTIRNDIKELVSVNDLKQFYLPAEL